MAIKGKKKAQTRGSQARRRPAAAPRPAYAARGPQIPWYKTPLGQVLAGVGLALIAGLIVWGVAAARSGSADQAAQQDAVDEYTGQIKAATQLINADVAEMSGVPLDGAALSEDLAKDAKGWKKAFTTALNQVSQIAPPPGLENANQLFAQSIQMYSTASEGFALVAQSDDVKLQSDLLAQSSKQRDQAAGIWLSAVGVLDAARADLEMTSSRLTQPGMGAVPQPATSTGTSTEITVPPIGEDTDGGTGGGKGDGKGKGGGKKGNK